MAFNAFCEKLMPSELLIEITQTRLPTHLLSHIKLHSDYRCGQRETLMNSCGSTILLWLSLTTYRRITRTASRQNIEQHMLPTIAICTRGSIVVVRLAAHPKGRGARWFAEHSGCEGGAVAVWAQMDD